MSQQNKASASYRKDLLRDLKDLDYAAGYLNACLDEGADAFLLGLHDVADAHGGIRLLAQKTGLNREHLFKMLSKTGNPRLESLRQLVQAIGMKLRLQPA